MSCASLIRYNKGDKQTLGMFIYGNFECDTLELSWKNNEQRTSCIPEGKYKVSRRYSGKYGWHFILHNVKDRGFILIHIGNYYTQTNGCILVGSGFKDINKDGYVDVLQSAKTMKKLNEILPKDIFELEIKTELSIER
jgi:hypothetical protein